MRELTLIVCLTIVLSPCTAPARTWHVFPDGTGDAPTIQAGLDSAAAGDTVRAHAGTYDVSIIFWPARNGIVLKGAGLESTILRGDAWQTVLYVANAVPIDSTSVICDLTLSNGGDAGIILYGASPSIDSCQVDSTANGPGIYGVSGTAAHITRCILRENSGPGVRLESSGQFLVKDSRIEGNSASAPSLLTLPTWNTYPGGFTVGAPVQSGGGIYCSESGPLIEGNWIGGNSAEGNGGGIYCSNSQPIIKENWIGENLTQYSGGGICCIGRATIIGNTLEGNSSTYSGGAGLYCVCSDSAGCWAVANVIIDNSTNSLGGGVYCIGSVNIRGNEISGNSAQSGGGLYCEGGSSADSNFIRGNTATHRGGGILCDRPERLAENIVYSNTAELGGGVCINRTMHTSVLEGNTIAENSASTDGGGLYAVTYEPSEAELLSNLFIRNSAYGSGGAAYLGTWRSDRIFTHNTIVENRAMELGQGVYTAGFTSSFTSCNIAYNGWGVHNSDPVSVPFLEGNWWGHASGPWHQGYNPAGRGDSLSAYAWDFQAWLAEPDTLAPPFPPTGADTTVFAEDSMVVHWRSSPISDVIGYRVYSNFGHPGPPYADTADVSSDTSYAFMDTTFVRYVAVTCYDRTGQESWYSPDVIVLPPETAGSHREAADAFGGQIVLENYPNPFDGETSIHYRLPEAGAVRLLVYDIQGRVVSSLVDEQKSAGSYTTILKGNSLSPGIYFYELSCGRQSVVRKAILLR
jgi:hypothetical protein